jgi:hypothetical protein
MSIRPSQPPKAADHTQRLSSRPLQPQEDAGQRSRVCGMGAEQPPAQAYCGVAQHAAVDPGSPRFYAVPADSRLLPQFGPCPCIQGQPRPQTTARNREHISNRPTTHQGARRSTQRHQRGTCTANTPRRHHNRRPRRQRSDIQEHEGSSDHNPANIAPDTPPAAEQTAFRTAR